MEASLSLGILKKNLINTAKRFSFYGLLLLSFQSSALAEHHSLTKQVHEPAQQSPLTIATWNMQWFDTTPTEPQQRRSEGDIAALKDYVSSLNADVIALQEVADLQSIYALWPKSDYIAFISPRQHAQRLAFVVKRSTGVAMSATIEPPLTALDVQGHGQLRYGLILTLNLPNKTLRLLNVHLKAGCFSQKHRGRPCQTLSQQISHINTWATLQPDSHVVLGDFNRQLKRANDPLQHTLASAKLNLVGHNNAKGCQLKHHKRNTLFSYHYFIDHILLSDDLLPKLVTNSFKHHSFNAKDVMSFKLSDHCALSLQLKP